MRIGNKLFPYPTLNNVVERSCFNNTRYSFECNDYSDEQYYVLEDAHIKINNEILESMIDNGILGVGMIIECSATIYRKMFELKLTPQTIKIGIGNLRDKVVVSCFIYAKQDIDKFANTDFLDDYEDITFKIEKNDIIAIDDGYTTVIDFDESSDKKVSSIFEVIRNKNVETMTVEGNTRSIVISLPEEEFANYNTLSKNDNYQNIFFSMLAIPALNLCLKEIQYNIRLEVYDFDSIEIEYRWFVSIKNAYKKVYGMELTEEIFKMIDTCALSQKLLNNGVLNGVKDLFDLSIRKQFGGDSDE